MSILRDCSHFRVLHTGRIGKFCWNADRNPYGLDHFCVIRSTDALVVCLQETKVASTNQCMFLSVFGTAYDR